MVDYKEKEPSTKEKFTGFKEETKNDQNTIADLQKNKEKLQEKPVFEVVQKTDSSKTNPITQKKKALVATGHYPDQCSQSTATTRVSETDIGHAHEW